MSEQVTPGDNIREYLVDKFARIYSPSDYWNLTAEYPTETMEMALSGVAVARDTVEPMVDEVLAWVGQNFIKCDHESRCCKTHGVHVNPHRGCILR